MNANGMHCFYCRSWNAEDEPRCRRCGRRLHLSAPRPAPETYPTEQVRSHGNAAPVVSLLPPIESDAPSAPAPPRVVALRQPRLFADGDNRRVLQFPRDPSSGPESKPVSSRPKSRRQPSLPPLETDQPYLDFLPPAPHASRTLKTAAEAVIYCDAPVATTTHRAVGFALDFAIVGLAMGFFLLACFFCGGTFEWKTGTLLGFLSAFVGIALFYGLIWVLTGSETAGSRWVGLRLINFDGFPIDRRERAMRFAAACLSVGSAGMGLLWALADEENLTWHDHISKTFPTIKA